MNTSINFNFHRVISVLKRDLIENKKTNLYRLFGCYAMLCVFFILNSSAMNIDSVYDYGHTAEFFYQRFCNNVLGVVIFFWILLSEYAASLIMENMSTKEKRISYLMLPATMLEKFVSRGIYVVFSVIVVFAISLPLAEITRLITVPIFDLPQEFKKFCLFDVAKMFIDQHKEPLIVGGIPYSYTLYMFTYFMTYVWIHSLFILGGSFFYTRAFIKTLAIMFSIAIIAGLLLANIIDSSFINFIGNISSDLSRTSANTVLCITGLVLIALTVLNWWLGYYLFCKSQITDRKLFRIWFRR